MPGWDTGILRFEAAGREGWNLIHSAGALPPILLQWGTGFDGPASQVLLTHPNNDDDDNVDNYYVWG